MFYLIMTFFAGICAGFIWRRIKAFSHVGKAVSLTVFVMLVFRAYRAAQRGICRGAAGSRTRDCGFADKYFQGDVHSGRGTSAMQMVRTFRSDSFGRGYGVRCLSSCHSEVFRRQDASVCHSERSRMRHERAFPGLFLLLVLTWHELRNVQAWQINLVFIPFLYIFVPLQGRVCLETTRYN